jgi:hypothetical protein
MFTRSRAAGDLATGQDFYQRVRIGQAILIVLGMLTLAAVSEASIERDDHQMCIQSDSGACLLADTGFPMLSGNKERHYTLVLGDQIRLPMPWLTHPIPNSDG